MDLSMFVNGDMGELVDIAGSDPVAGDWRHKAFIPAPLDDDEPTEQQAVMAIPCWEVAAKKVHLWTVSSLIIYLVLI